jgi:hypothetical protein
VRVGHLGFGLSAWCQRFVLTPTCMARLSTVGVLPAELVAYILSQISGMKGNTANLKHR